MVFTKLFFHAADPSTGLLLAFATFGLAFSRAGLFLATGAFSLASEFSGENFLNWGWRVPFLLSLLDFRVPVLVVL